jgi:hypothetical protein
MLVRDTERDHMQTFLSTKQGTATPEQREKIFQPEDAASEDVRGAVRYLPERERGGVLMHTDIDAKSGDTVAEVLLSKHPEG